MIFMRAFVLIVPLASAQSLGMEMSMGCGNMSCYSTNAFMVRQPNRTQRDSTADDGHHLALLLRDTVCGLPHSG